MNTYLHYIFVINMHDNTKQAMNKLGGEVSKKWKKSCKGNNSETSRDEKYTIWNEKCLGKNNRLLETVGEKFRDFRDVKIETIQNDAQREK